MIIDRILQIIEFKGINKSKFYTQTGLSNGFLDKVKDIGSSKVEQILNSFPDINPIWLVTGKGEMVLNENITPKDILQEIQTLSEEDQKSLYKIIDLYIQDSKKRNSEK